jgi:hypothetical protein
MSFLVNASEEEIISGAAYAAYRRHLETIRPNLPTHVYEFTVADWHYDFSDHRCPHDAWIEKIQIEELSSGPRHEVRKTRITIKLLGAHHDRIFTLVYDDVVSYAIDVPQAMTATISHGDWIIDEIGLSASKAIVHEIKFWCGPDASPTLRIESRDLSFSEEMLPAD